MIPETEPFPTPILEVVVGSTLHGVAVDDGLEDLDLMAVTVETPQQFIGFDSEDTWTYRSKPEGVRSEAGDVDFTAYGLQKYLRLALNNNPTLLLALFAPEEFIRRHDVHGLQLQALHPYIVSKRCYEPFKHYMRAQHERLLGLRGQRNVTRPELVEKFGYDTKYAAHIVRLGIQGKELLLTGRLTLPMPEEDRELVVAVRNGRYTLAGVSELIVQTEDALDGAFYKSIVREEPNRAIVEDWMMQTYLGMWYQRDGTTDLRLAGLLAGTP